MEITINDQRKISDIQKEFNEMFPYLKLEFFAKPHSKGGGSSKKLMRTHSKTLMECRSIHTKGHVTITPLITVADMEQEFQDRYGLSVQVFRQSGRIWLQTTATDSWTLEKQNSEGEALSNFKRETKLPEIDME